MLKCNPAVIFLIKKRIRTELVIDLEVGAKRDPLFIYGTVLGMKYKKSVITDYAPFHIKDLEKLNCF